MSVYFFSLITLIAFAIFCFFMHTKESNKRRLRSTRQRYRLGRKSA